MDQTTPIISNIYLPEYKKIVIETTTGWRYTADLSFFSRVACFPKNGSEWQTASIDNDGLAVIWKTRFEVHVDQVIGLALSKQKITSSDTMPINP